MHPSSSMYTAAVLLVPQNESLVLGKMILLYFLFSSSYY
jgi:hypothetical protein